ncbi:MAG TPA: hypothetical protein VMB21_03155 [Candidatus Limnocylindria bacterium]|jgi:hypothetical protein|nr:hypothetical protein [Candidatus Limnocylindria bacterium]
MRFRSRELLCLPLLAALLGCKKEEIQVYQAPKDMIAPAPAMGSAPASAPAEPGAARTPWTVPAGWTEKEASGMRIATYSISAPDGRTADASVVPLGPTAGSELDNVNRWRGQLGLGSVTDAELAPLTAAVPIGSVMGKLYDLVGDKPTLDDKYKARTLAAVLSVGGATVFFKLTGEDALVAENKPKFLAWLKSVDTGDGGDTATSAAPTASAPPMAAPSPGMAGPVAPPPSTGQPQWEVPAGWKSVPASTMRVASFAVGEGGDFSVVALGPAAGGTLANLNRWRGQMGLGAVSEGEIPTTTTPLTLPGGEKAVMADLTGEGAGAGKKMLAAIVARPDRTWFYKLTGSAAVVSAEHDNFVKFVQSVKY